MYLTKQPLVKKAALRALGNVAKKGLLVGGLGLGGYGLAKANSNWDHSASYKENASRLLDKLKNFKFSEMLNGLSLDERLAKVSDEFDYLTRGAKDKDKLTAARDLYLNRAGSLPLTERMGMADEDYSRMHQDSRPEGRTHAAFNLFKKYLNSGVDPQLIDADLREKWHPFLDSAR